MSAIGSGGGTSYPSAIDTALAEVNSPNAGKTKARAEVPNDQNAAIIAIETTLGTTPQGTTVDVKTFLQTEHGVDGTHSPTIIVKTTGNQAIAGIKTYSNQQIWSKGADVASAASIALGTDGNFFDITGTTTITSIQSKGVGITVKLQFDSALTLTHDASNLVLPNGENITTVAGDVYEFTEYSSADWILTGSSKAIIIDSQVTTAKIADGSIVNSKFLALTAGDFIFHSNNAELTTTSGTPVKLKETIIGRPGTLRIKFGIFVDDSGAGTEHCFGQIYRNGTPVGTLHDITGQVEQTVSQDISGWSVDDLVQVFGHSTDSDTCHILNLKIYAAEYEGAASIS